MSRLSKKDNKEAHRYLTLAAKEKCIEAQQTLYKLSFSNELDFSDEKEAEFWLREGAGQEDAESQYRLAVFLEIHSKATSSQEIVDNYTKSSDQNFPDALYMLGLCYAEGDLVPMDEKKGRELLEKAAKLGHVNAHFQLGKLFTNVEF